MKRSSKILVSCCLSFSAFGVLLTACLTGSATQELKAEVTKSSEITQEESCTVMYVGKSVSENGLPIIARTGDGRNSLIYLNVRVYEKNELASKVMKGKGGFTWDMPKETYQFTGFPRSKAVDTAEFWAVSTMNEEGLAVSATLSCFSDEERVLKYDPFIDTGITEDNIAGVLAATCNSAKGAMEYLANIIDIKGSGEPNIVLTLDQNEAWLMEIYSGHQYCAIKLPDDKATTIGNEFFLDTLSSFDDKDIITSKNLFNLPKDKGFAVFNGEEVDKNMNLFSTYARPLTYKDDVKVDGSHMRTWRGRDLFAKEEERVDYKTTVKYEPFFSPKRKLNINDFYTYFRDTYLDLLENPDPKYDYFRQRDKDGFLRCVATETSYQVHVMMSHPDLAKEIAVESWICLGNAIGAPFVPFNNSMTKFPEEYTHETKYYGSDEESALFLFRRVSAIAYLHEKEYALPVQKFWNIYEDIWHKQYDLCLIKAKELINSNNKDDAKRLLNNYLFDAQSKAISEAKYLYEDLLTEFIETQKRFNETIFEFEPKTNIFTFADLYDYSHEVNKTTITLKKDSRVITIETEGFDSNSDAMIICDGEKQSFAMRLTGDKYYGDMLTLNRFLSKNTSLKELNYNELMSRGYSSSMTPISAIAIIIFLLFLICVLIFTSIKRKDHKENKIREKTK